MIRRRLQNGERLNRDAQRHAVDRTSHGHPSHGTSYVPSATPNGSATPARRLPPVRREVNDNRAFRPTMASVTAMAERFGMDCPSESVGIGKSFRGD